MSPKSVQPTQKNFGIIGLLPPGTSIYFEPVLSVMQTGRVVDLAVAVASDTGVNLSSLHDAITRAIQHSLRVHASADGDPVSLEIGWDQESVWVAIGCSLQPDTLSDDAQSFMNRLETKEPVGAFESDLVHFAHAVDNLIYRVHMDSLRFETAFRLGRGKPIPSGSSQIEVDLMRGEELAFSEFAKLEPLSAEFEELNKKAEKKSPTGELIKAVNRAKPENKELTQALVEKLGLSEAQLATIVSEELTPKQIATYFLDNLDSEEIADVLKNGSDDVIQSVLIGEISDPDQDEIDQLEAKELQDAEDSITSLGQRPEKDKRQEASGKSKKKSKQKTVAQLISSKLSLEQISELIPEDMSDQELMALAKQSLSRAELAQIVAQSDPKRVAAQLAEKVSEEELTELVELHLTQEEKAKAVAQANPERAMQAIQVAMSEDQIQALLMDGLSTSEKGKMALDAVPEGELQKVLEKCLQGAMSEDASPELVQATAKAITDSMDKETLKKVVEKNLPDHKKAEVLAKQNPKKAARALAKELGSEKVSQLVTGKMSDEEKAEILKAGLTEKELARLVKGSMSEAELVQVVSGNFPLEDIAETLVKGFTEKELKEIIQAGIPDAELANALTEGLSKKQLAELVSKVVPPEELAEVLKNVSDVSKAVGALKVAAKALQGQSKLPLKKVSNDQLKKIAEVGNRGGSAEELAEALGDSVPKAVAQAIVSGNVPLDQIAELLKPLLPAGANASAVAKKLSPQAPEKLEGSAVLKNAKAQDLKDQFYQARVRELENTVTKLEKNISDNASRVADSDQSEEDGTEDLLTPEEKQELREKIEEQKKKIIALEKELETLKQQQAELAQIAAARAASPVPTVNTVIKTVVEKVAADPVPTVTDSVVQETSTTTVVDPNEGYPAPSGTTPDMQKLAESLAAIEQVKSVKPIDGSGEGESEISRVFEEGASTIEKGLSQMIQSTSDLQLTDERVRKRIDEVMQDLLVQRSHLQDLSKKLTTAAKKHDLQSRAREMQLAEELRQSKAMVASKHSANERLKELMVRMQKKVEEMKKVSMNSNTETTQFRLKAEQSERQAKELQLEVERLNRKLSHIQNQKDAGGGTGTGASGKSTGEMQRQLEAVNKTLLGKKQELELAKRQLNEKNVQEAEYKRMIARLTKQIEDLQAQPATKRSA